MAQGTLKGVKRAQSLSVHSGEESVRSDEPQLELRNVTRRYGHVAAVNGADFDVCAGEIFALLGPSGCGKTTSLRIVAGLETLDEGRVAMGNVVLADTADRKFLPPEKRNIAMVFQSYAIWPHMTVAQNVGFPLRMRHIRRRERRTRVLEMLELTGLSEAADRSATMLSGGQQQRVALARALIYTPDLLLLDEPLSNLDAKLRHQMRQELRRLNKDLGVTMLFVTHDQDEALSLADRVAVMNQGRIEQIGTPSELYEKPKTEFARDFLGRLVMLKGVLTQAEPNLKIRLDDPALGGEVLTMVRSGGPLAVGSAVAVCSRPEDVSITPVGDQHEPLPNEVRAEVTSVAYLGDHLEYTVTIGGTTAVLTGSRGTDLSAGDIVRIRLDPDCATVWPL